MWVCSVQGFFSAVEHRSDSTQVMIRTRDRRHVANLQRLMAWDEPVTFTPDADYPYRIVTTKARWAEAVAKLADGITYANFKDAAASNSTRTGGIYIHALHEIWETLWRAYAETRYGRERDTARLRR